MLPTRSDLSPSPETGSTAPATNDTASSSAARSLDHTFSLDEVLHQPLAKARLLAQLQPLLLAALPAWLGPRCRIANFRDGKLIVFVDSPTAVTELRFRQHALQREFSAHLGEPSLSLEIRVNPDAF